MTKEECVRNDTDLTGLKGTVEAGETWRWTRFHPLLLVGRVVAWTAPVSTLAMFRSPSLSLRNCRMLKSLFKYPRVVKCF